MPITEAFRLGDDGKVIPGVTVLRDPQTGEEYVVTDVASGKLPTPIDLTNELHGPSAAGRCAIYGGPVRSKEG